MQSQTVIVLLVLAVTCALCTTCPKLPPHNATNIFELKPADIKVVMSLGDSITAGFSINGGILENRGGTKTYNFYFFTESWSIGGDENALTIPNLLQSIVSHKIHGASFGSHIPELPFMPYLHGDNLNGAQSNAIAQDMMKQINHIHAQVVANPDIDMDKDWKMLTILIGANNVCYFCKKGMLDKYDNGDKFEEAMCTVLERTRELFPRVFINLVQMFNVSQVYYIALPDQHCLERHEILGSIECSCCFGKNDTNRQYMDLLIQEYNKRTTKLAEEFNARKYNDFAVVVQPMLRNFKIPDVSYLSPADCFHPNLKGHHALATALWNTMFVPQAKKQHDSDPSAPVFCPTADSLLYAN